MGMDAYLYKCRSLKQIREFDWNKDHLDLRDEEALRQNIELDDKILMQEVGLYEPLYSFASSSSRLEVST